MVEVKLNYSVPSDRTPVIINGDYTKNITNLMPSDVVIADAGSLPEAPTLDVEGLACVRFAGDFSEVADSHEAWENYRAKLREFMLELTGADEVHVIETPVFRRQSDLAGGTDLTREPPVEFVHSDFSLKGFDLVMPRFDPTEKPTRRVALINTWKLLSKGPTNRPLALCDARSASEEDVIPGESRFPTLDNFFFETAFIRHNPNHRWVYWPDLTSDDLLVFKQGDTEPGAPRIVPHTAFSDPSAPADATPRISVEARCRAVWYA